MRGKTRYMANSIIFVINGVIIMEKALLSDVIIASDWLHLGGLYLALTCIRFFVTFLFSPILRNTGSRASYADLTVAAWGGLRGAVCFNFVIRLPMSIPISILTRQFEAYLLLQCPFGIQPGWTRAGINGESRPWN